MFNIGHIISLGIILFGIIVIVIFLLVVRKIRKNCTEKITAVVTNVESRYSYSSNRHRKTRSACTFTYHGAEFTVIKSGFAASKRVGDTQTLYIDPQNPEKCYAIGDLFIPGFLIFWGVCVVFGGLIAFVSFFFV